VVTSRVFSGQYFIWLLALGAICLAEPATAARRAVHLLVAAGLATQLVYPWLYTALLEGAWYAVLAQSLRVGLSVAAAVLLVRMLLRAARQMPAPSPHGSSGS
jgi:hypothetical protein